MEGTKFHELPRIDYRMMCADLEDRDLRNFDQWPRGTVSKWLRLTGIPTCVNGMSWRDGGLTIPASEGGQCTMIIRTLCDVMRSGDPGVRKLMRQFEKEQGEALGFTIQDRLPDEDKGFMRWANVNAPDMRKWPNVKMQSIFTRAYKACQLTDIRVWIEEDGGVQLMHDLATPFRECKITRPAMWITQDVMRKTHLLSFKNSVQTSQGWWEYEDNTVSNHWLNWTTSRYDDEMLRHGIEMRLGMLKTPANQFRDHGRESRCPFGGEPNPNLKHIMTKCQHHGATLIMERHNRIGSAVLKGIKEGRPNVEVWEDMRVNEYLRIFAHPTGVKRPDLMSDSVYVKRGRKGMVIN
jgi:hypothetical protein